MTGIARSPALKIPIVNRMKVNGPAMGRNAAAASAADCTLFWPCAKSVAAAVTMMK